MLRKYLIIGVMFLFFCIYTYPIYISCFTTSRAIDNKLQYLASSTEFNQQSLDTQFRDIIWDATLSFIEPNNANDLLLSLLPYLQQDQELPRKDRALLLTYQANLQLRYT